MWSYVLMADGDVPVGMCGAVLFIVFCCSTRNVAIQSSSSSRLRIINIVFTAGQPGHGLDYLFGREREEVRCIVL